VENNENKLGTMSIPKLLFQVSFPIVISMFIQSMYNLVDSYYIGKINEEAFTAISIAFPIQNIMIGIGVGTGVGMNSLLSRYLGEKNYEKSNNTAEVGFFSCYNVWNYFTYTLEIFATTFFICTDG